MKYPRTFVFRSHSIHVSFHPVEQLINEHVISMTATSETDTEWKPLSIEEQVDHTSNFPWGGGTKDQLSTWHMCMNLKYVTQ